MTPRQLVYYALACLAILLLTGWGFMFTGGGTIVGGTGIPVYVAAGAASPYTDATGQVWQADIGFTGGNAASTTAIVSNTGDPGLYQNARVAPVAGSFTYTVNMNGGGLFRVREMVSETNSLAVQGSRVEQIKLSCDGTAQVTHTNLDILNPASLCGAATGLNRACIVADWVSCSGATPLTIEFDSIVGNAIVNAISVLPSKTVTLSFPATPTPTPTPSPGPGPQLVQCISGQATGTALQITIPVGSGNSLVAFHKGISAEPAISDSQTNTWAPSAATNGTSGGCLNFDSVLTPVSSGPGINDQVTIQPASTTAYNAATVCTLTNLAQVDLAGGASYVSGVTNALSGLITPSVNSDTILTMFYTENIGNGVPVFSGASSNQTGSGTPTDIVLGGSATNANILLGNAFENGVLNQSTQLQRGFSPSGAYCGGIVALSSQLLAVASVGVGCNPNTIAVGNTSSCTATATFTNGTTQNVTSSAAWSSSNTGVATVNSSGTATGVAAGTTNINAVYRGVTGSGSLTVGSTTVFPHLGNTGTVLSSYTPGASLFVRAPFEYSNSQPGSTVSDTLNAAINVYDSGGLYYLAPNDPNANCSSSTFSVATTDGLWQTHPCQNWHLWWQNAVFNPARAQFQSHGSIPQIVYSDDLNTYAIGVPWTYPAVTDFSQQLVSLAVPQKMVVGVIGADEYNGNPAGAGTTAMLQALGLPNIFIHVPYGPEPFFASQYRDTWYGNPAYSDWGSEEDPTGSAETTTDTYDDLVGVQSILATAQTARGGQYPLVNSSGTCSGPYYAKRISGGQYTPGVDLLRAGAATPGTIVARILGSVAIGTIGSRVYRYDLAGDAQGRTSHAVCTGPLNINGCDAGDGPQTGCSSVPARSVISNALGQDRWYAMSAANNVIKAFEPYTLQPMMTAPACSNPVICGAHSGNGGRLVVFLNASSSNTTVSFNPSNYVFAGGTTQAYAVIGNDQRGDNVACTGNCVPSVDAVCGAQATLPSVSDCGVGSTTIIGATTVNTWCNDVGCPGGATSMPAPSTTMAPITTTNIGSCSGQMCPMEVDVFLYSAVAPSPVTIPGTGTHVGAGSSFTTDGFSCPAESNPQNPVTFGADSSGTNDSSVAIATALSSGDVMFSTPGTYKVNLTGSATNLTTHGIVLPAGRKIECAAGVTLKETTALPPAGDAAMLWLANGGNEICGCDLQGANTGTAPLGIQSISSLWGQIGITGSGSGYTVENNTFENTSGNSSIFTSLDYSGSGPTNVTVRYNTFSRIPYYSFVLDGPTTTAAISHNYQTDGAIGNEWDNCGSGSAGSAITFTDNMTTVTSGDCVQFGGQSCSATGFASGVPSTCNYSGTTFGGSTANANYCTGTGTITAAYTNNSQVTNPAVYSSNILGSNCICQSGGSC
jgi:hypothetical protein